MTALLYHLDPLRELGAEEVIDRNETKSAGRTSLARSCWVRGAVDEDHRD